MSDLWIFLAGVFFTLTVLLIVRLGQLVAELRRRANPATRHDWRALDRHEVGESLLFEIANLRTAIDEAKLREAQLTARLEHVAAGGHPDDPRSQWRKLRKD